jgi:hypothetical protein
MTLEELLNKLIEKGWKPFNVDCAWTNVEVINKIKYYWYIPEHSKIIFKTETHWHVFDCNIRDLVSKWSWLWQFVCENGMVDRHKYDSKTYEVRIENWIKRREIWPEWEVSINNSWRWRWSAEYRLIESALTDEDRLEEFLLNNIKIDE